MSLEERYLYNRESSNDIWLLLAAQALLGDWLSSKLRLELEMEMEEEEDDLMCSTERRSPVALACAQPAALNYSNFDGTKPGGKLCYLFS